MLPLMFLMQAFPMMTQIQKDYGSEGGVFSLAIVVDIAAAAAAIVVAVVCCVLRVKYPWI